MDLHDHMVDKFNANEDNLRSLEVKKRNTVDPNEVDLINELIIDGKRKRKELFEKLDNFRTNWWE